MLAKIKRNSLRLNTHAILSGWKNILPSWNPRKYILTTEYPQKTKLWRLLQPLELRFLCPYIKATPHKARLTALHAICLQIFRHIAQKFLAGRAAHIAAKAAMRNFYTIWRKIWRRILRTRFVRCCLYTIYARNLQNITERIWWNGTVRKWMGRDNEGRIWQGILCQAPRIS